MKRRLFILLGLVTARLAAAQTAVGRLGRGIPQGLGPAPLSGGGAYAVAYTVNTTGWLTVPIAAAQGDIPLGTGVSIGGLSTQLDVKNRWADNSAKFGLITAKLTNTGSKTIASAAAVGGTFTPTPPTLAVQLVITAGVGAGSTYTATLGSYSASDKWLDGPNVVEWRKQVTPTKAGPVDHDNLSVIFDVRSFVDGDHRVNVQVLNCRDSANMDSATYTVTILVNGVGVATDYVSAGGTSHTHYSFTAWQQIVYIGAGQEATCTFNFSKFYTAYLLPKPIAGITTVDYTATLATAQFALGKWGLYTDGILNGQGAMPWLAPFDNWSMIFLTHQTASQRKVLLYQAFNAICSWTCGYVLRSDGSSTSLYQSTDPIEGSLNMTPNANVYPANLKCPIFFPTLGGSTMYRGGADNITGYERMEDEHMPAVGIIAYYVTGDRCYLDAAKHIANFHIMHSLVGAWTWADVADDGSAIKVDRNALPGAYGVLGNYQADPRALSRTTKNVFYAAQMCPDADVHRTYLLASSNDTLAWMAYYHGKRTPPGTQWGDGQVFWEGGNLYNIYDTPTGTTQLSTSGYLQLYGVIEYAFNVYWANLQGIFTVPAGALALAKRMVGPTVAMTTHPATLNVGMGLGCYGYVAPRRATIGALPLTYPATFADLSQELINAIFLNGNDQRYTVSVDVALKKLTASTPAFTAGMVGYQVAVWGPYASNWTEQRYRNYGSGDIQIGRGGCYTVASYIDSTHVTLDRAPAVLDATGGTISFQTLPPVVNGGDGPQHRTAIYLADYWGVTDAAAAKVACDAYGPGEIAAALQTFMPGFGIQIPQT